MNSKELLISQYIDDELSLPEKAEFVEEISADRAFAREALALVRQEIRLSEDLVFLPPGGQKAPKTRPRRRALRWAAAPLALAACLAFLLLARPAKSPAPAAPALVAHRFVIYRPDAASVELSGNFNNWSPIPMRPAGNGGYWEAVVSLPAGEYRYSFVVGRGLRVPDPTLLAREGDGFGGENSILRVVAPG